MKSFKYSWPVPIITTAQKLAYNLKEVLDAAKIELESAINLVHYTVSPFDNDGFSSLGSGAP